VPFIGIGQNSDEFDGDYLEPESIMSWTDTAGGYHELCPIGYNESGQIAYRKYYELNDGIGYYLDRIVIQSFVYGFGNGNLGIVDEFILCEFASETDDGNCFNDTWDAKYLSIYSFLSKWRIFDSF